MTQQLIDIARQFLAGDISEDSFLDSVCNRPSWDTAPEWANYLAQDSCGRWYWYETLPKVNEDNCEWHKEPLSEMCQATVSSWEATLQQRP